MSNVLVFVEQADGQVKKASLTGLSAAQEIVAKTGGSFSVLLAGKGAQGAAEGVKSFGASKVFVAEHPSFENYLAESYTTLLVKAAETAGADFILGAASSTTKDLLPRVAARLDAAMATDVMAVVDGETFKRPMWAGNVTATVKLLTPKKVASVRSTEFEAPTSAGDASIEALDTSVDLETLKSKFVDIKVVKSERPDVTTADVVVSGGRGVKSADGFKVIEELADVLNAGVGASRAVCDAGWVANDLQVGQTGKVVAPNLYFAIGISGAIQHLAGMKSSKTIVAINKDPEAPIFSVADYGLVADLFDVVPELIEKIKAIQ